MLMVRRQRTVNCTEQINNTELRHSRDRNVTKRQEILAGKAVTPSAGVLAVSDLSPAARRRNDRALVAPTIL